jgi:hypothetical protein
VLKVRLTGQIVTYPKAKPIFQSVKSVVKILLLLSSPEIELPNMIVV